MSKLFFIYNVNSGKLNALLDTIHKQFSPKTYQCNLCALTYGTFLENKKWKKFRKESAFEMVFLHRDEFQKKYASKFEAKHSFPIVLIENFQDLEVFVTTKKLSEISTVDELIQLIEENGKNSRNTQIPS